ncbi:sodium-coupled monocarboxylate transporter 1 [Plakobranchus ocellatus]|uniref:Sodium-coupled monocarboxylate transporter 1 n=1 Tax=Plakobranchus ocellatus TaxID=259542 RepID=A0AAV4CQ09_9GAST|nr:sodium-coupled monocarboxylate transporter 1 [Plakobranchus ocellatus]
MVHLKNEFTPWDYLVFIGMLVISMAIGVFFALRGDRQRTQGEYLMGGRSMSLLPVAISILVSFQSAILMLGTPAEMYTQGAEFFISVFGSGLGFVIGGVMFVPLLYPLGITSAFEYLERRFHSRAVRLLGTCIMTISQLTYMGIASYAPSTALEAVTGFPVWATLLIIGVVATFYTTIGGMKAVVWTDVFQACVMFAGITSIVIQGTIKANGFARVWEINQEWDRTHFFTWSADPRIRHTVWSLVIGNALSWMGISGLSQPAVQRYCSLPTLRQAQASVLINVIGIFAFFIMACSAGMVMFAYYAGQNCDLIGQGLVDNPNQLIPYLVMDILAYPAVPGLFMSSLFSGALSSVSSSMNSLAAITWEDALKPHLGRRLTEYKKTVVIKILVAAYGLIAVAISYLMTYVEGTVIQAAVSFQAPTGGALTGLFLLGALFPFANKYAAVSFQAPTGGALTGLFLLGALFPFANKYGAFVGGFAGLCIGMWRAVGGYVKGLEYKILPFPNGTCTSGVALNSSMYTEAPETSTVFTTQASCTSSSAENEKGIFDDFYSISYMWVAMLTISTCLVAGVVVSLATRRWMTKEEKEVPTMYQIPVFTRIFCCLPDSWLYYLDCCRPFEKPEDIAHRRDVEIYVDPPSEMNIFGPPFTHDEKKLVNGNSQSVEMQEKNNGVNNPGFVKEGDLRLLGPPSGQGAGRGARTRDRRVPPDLRSDSLATASPPLHRDLEL